MAADNGTHAAPLAADRPTLADIVEQLVRFEGPPEQFLLNLLAVQCHVSSASAGAILRGGPEGKTEVLSLYPPQPPDSTAPVWLAQAVESIGQVMATGRTLIKSLRSADDLYGQPSQQHVVMVPIRGGTNVRGCSAFFVENRDASVLGAIRDRLELTSSWLSLYEMRLTLARRQSDLRRLRVTMETLAAVNEQERFTATAMTLCNEVTSRWQADRTAIGLLKGRYVKLKALSHTEKFSRKQKLVQDFEAAMEECIDQNVEIVHPAPQNATYVSRATEDLCKHYGPAAIVSMPLRQAGQPIAVLTVQRAVDKPFSLEELEALRLACDLCTPRVSVLHEHDRWVGSKLVSGARKTAGFIVGPKHTWVKLAVLLIVAGLLFVTFANGTRRAEAPFTLEATERQIVSAPYDGFLVDLGVDASGELVHPGTRVHRGDLLGQLKTDDWMPKLAGAIAARDEVQAKADTAQDAGKLDEWRSYKAQVDKADAEIQFIKLQIAQARLTAPIDGVVIAGDWRNARGPVKHGDLLFEVAPIDELYADLSLPEDQIADVYEGREGELACTAYPDQRVRFRVEQVNPVAEVVEQQNVFKVRVKLLGRKPWMLIKMQGVAKITLNEEPYGKLWTRRLVNWVRMTLWL